MGWGWGQKCPQTLWGLESRVSLLQLEAGELGFPRNVPGVQNPPWHPRGTVHPLASWPVVAALNAGPAGGPGVRLSW